jgi:hypothetical protein
LSLGTAFNAGVTQAAADNMEFTYLTTAGAIISGTVTVMDIPDMGLLGDFNGDGAVDAADYTLWRDNEGAPNESAFATGSGNGGGIDASDYTLWRANFGNSAGALVGSGAVPEPAALALATLACCGAMLLHRKRRSERRIETEPRNSKLKNAIMLQRGLLGLAVTCCVAWVGMGSTSQATVYNDRVYQFGDDSLEGTITPGVTIVGAGGGNVSPGSTIDTGVPGDPSGTFIDLPQVGGPIYVDVSTIGAGRPGSTSGDIGIRFDGIDDLVAGTPLNRPDELASLIGGSYPLNYMGITARGAQLWVFPDAAAIGTARQVVMMDTVAAGGVAITAGGLWTQINDGHANDTDIEPTVPVVGNQWYHVMHHVYPSSAPDAPEVVPGTGSNDLGFTSVLYVNGVAVSANNDTIALGDLTAGNRVGRLSFGAAEIAGDGISPTFGEFFRGTIDDADLYVFGNNIAQGGQNYGTFNLFDDNEWIANAIASLPNGTLQPGDLDKDGNIDQDDIDDYMAGWGSENRFQGAHNALTVGDWLTWEQGDLNHDGVNDLNDAFIMHNALINAGLGGLDFSQLGAVPEPSAMCLLGGAIGGIALRVRFVRHRRTI